MSYTPLRQRTRSNSPDNPEVVSLTNPNTGFFTPDMESWALSVDGNEVMRWYADGWVGIGLPNPETMLHVGGDIATNGTLIVSKADSFNAIRLKQESGWLEMENLYHSTPARVRTGDLDVQGILTTEDVPYNQNLHNSFNGITLTHESGEALAAGDVVYLSGTRWYKACAVHDGHATRLLGIATQTAPSSNYTITVLIRGVAHFTNRFSPLAGGEALWLSEAFGEVATEAPTTPGYINRPIGYALGANGIYFDPSTSWHVVA